MAKGFVGEEAVTWARQREEQIRPHLLASTEQDAPVLVLEPWRVSRARFWVLGRSQVPNW